MLYPRSYQQARVQAQHPSTIHVHPAYTQRQQYIYQQPHQRQHQATTEARHEQRKLVSLVVFFGLWMGAGVVLLLSYMFEYLV